jgi:hypothetical protein
MVRIETYIVSLLLSAIYVRVSTWACDDGYKTHKSQLLTWFSERTEAAGQWLSKYLHKVPLPGSTPRKLSQSTFLFFFCLLSLPSAKVISRDDSRVTLKIGHFNDCIGSANCIKAICPHRAVLAQ